MSGPKSKRRKPRAASPATGGKSGRAVIVVTVLLAIAVIVVLMLPSRKKTGVGRPVDVEIPPGASDQEVVARLEAAGVVEQGRGFSLYLRTRGGAQAKPGRHFLADDLSWVEVLRRLRRTPDATKVRVTIPEGWNRFDVAKRLKEKRVCDDAAFLAATIDAKLLDDIGIPYGTWVTAEGWLFPATYELPTDVEPAEVVRRMTSETRQRIDRIVAMNPGALERLKPFTIRDAIVLASIVEKEAVVDDERPLIASVFLNRLRDPSQTGGRLEADPTASYGCLTGSAAPSCGPWLAAGPGKPTAAIEHDLQNAWSTYTHPGLPPTPIANPGEKSIAAVLAPANTKYLYFVAKGGGRHTFSETLGAHEKAVNGGK